jgi:hypothetical protein
MAHRGITATLTELDAAMRPHGTILRGRGYYSFMTQEPGGDSTITVFHCLPALILMYKVLLEHNDRYINFMYKGPIFLLEDTTSFSKRTALFLAVIVGVLAAFFKWMPLDSKCTVHDETRPGKTIHPCWPWAGGFSLVAISLTMMVLGYCIYIPERRAARKKFIAELNLKFDNPAYDAMLNQFLTDSGVVIPGTLNWSATVKFNNKECSLRKLCMMMLTTFDEELNEKMLSPILDTLIRNRPYHFKITTLATKDTIDCIITPEGPICDFREGVTAETMPTLTTPLSVAVLPWRSARADGVPTLTLPGTMNIG